MQINLSIVYYTVKCRLRTLRRWLLVVFCNPFHVFKIIIGDEGVLSRMGRAAVFATQRAGRRNPTSETYKKATGFQKILETLAPK